MATIYYENQADPDLIKDKRIAILGYGSQGHAHALNLRDSGMSVVVGLYEGSRSRSKAEADGLEVMPTADAVASADITMVLLPDQVQGQIYREEIQQGLNPGDTLMFAHGFNIRFGQIVPPADVDVSMVAPKAPGHRVREVFTEGSGVPGLVAIHQDASGQALANALSYGRGLGCTRAGVLETTFAEETETDLFGEQAVLCGGVSELVKAAFETLVEAGYQPEIAYFECLHELKLIVDLFYEGGLAYMRYSVSDTAEWGDYVSGQRIVTDETRKAMKQILEEVTSGRFAEEWMDEYYSGLSNFKARRRREQYQQIEEVGLELRRMMTFLNAQEVEREA